MNPNTLATSELTPCVAQIQASFDKNFRLSRSLVGKALTNFGPAWCTDFEAVITSICTGSEELEAAIKGYTKFAMDSMRRQKAFEEALEYPKKSYAEAAGEVYFNETHMMREYLPGLLLSHFLWPHHYRQLQFFDTAFMAPMALAKDVRFAEVGIGTAVYSRRILSKLGHAVGKGYDISPSSCEFTRRHLAGAGVASRFSLHLQDIVAQHIEPVPWLVCVEVLEHLEQPVQFLKALRAGLAPQGRAFITAALNAAHADHIYLYRTSEEVWAHLEAAGFTLEQSFVAAAYAPPRPGAPVPLAAAFVVS